MYKKPQNIDELISYLTAHPHVDFSHEYNGRTIWRESRMFEKFCNNKLYWTDPLMVVKLTPTSPCVTGSGDINMEFLNNRFIIKWASTEDENSARFVFHYKD